MSTLDKLLDAIGSGPDLPDAACRGMSLAFDPAERGEDPADVEYRHQTALRICVTCPALASCRAWFDALPRSQRPQGVVAGVVNRPKPPGRPRQGVGGSNPLTPTLRPPPR